MIGKVTISPDVLREVARVTTLATPGVLAMAERPPRSSRGPVDTGVDVSVQANSVQLRLRVIASSDIKLYKLGQQIQSDVAGAIQEITGMSVTSVDVTFEDVRRKA